MIGEVRPPERWSRVRCCLAAIVLALAMSGPAAARVVGVLFDDSGSMRDRIHMSTFGAQLLMSSLDGRPGHDRLFTLRLSQVFGALGVGGKLEYLKRGDITADTVKAWLTRARGPVVTEEAIATGAQHQATLDQVRTQWPRASVDTPYEAVEIMLDMLVDTVPQGGEAVIVILTDGEFDRAPSSDIVGASFAKYAERLRQKRATLRAEFLLIAPDDPKLVAVVRQQRVRELLLSTFNNDPASGSFDVVDLGRLGDSLKDVVADIVGIDRRRQGQYLSAAGNSLTIETPLSVTSLVSVATAVIPLPPPRLSTIPGNPVERRTLSSAMERADNAPSIRNQRLTGMTDQMRFQPALPPGRHTLGYDRPIGQDAFLLFETGAYVDITVTLPDGAPAPRDATGYVLSKGLPYRLVATLMDSVGGGGAPAPVALASVRGRTLLTGYIEGDAGTGNVALEPAAAVGQAAGAFTLSGLGSAQARVQARLEGFVSPPSRPVQIRVVDGTVNFDVRVVPAEPCTTCGKDEVRIALHDDPAGRPVGRIVVTPHAAMDGTARLDLSGLPPSLTLRQPSGPALTQGDLVPLADGRPVEFELRTAGATAAIGRTPFSIRLEAALPLQGGAASAGVVVAYPPAMSLDVTLSPAEPCRACAPGELQATFAAGGAPRTVATLEINPHAERPGAVSLDLTGLPPGLRLVVRGRGPLQPGERLPVTDGQAVVLELVAESRLAQRSARLFRIGVAAVAPHAATAEATGSIRYVVPEARLVYTSNGQGAADTIPHLTGTDLTAGSFPLDFVLEDALAAPRPADFHVDGPSFLSHGVTVAGNNVRVSPTGSSWCLCLLYFGDGQQRIAVRWEHGDSLQSAQATAAYVVRPTGMEALRSCGLMLLILFGVIWLLMSLLTMLRTRHFPRGSVAEVTEGAALPIYKDLRQFNWTVVRSLFPWRAFRLSSPHAWAVVEGIVFEAAANGASILLRRSIDDFMVVSRSQTAREIMTENPRLERLRAMWNEEFERDLAGRVSIRLLRRMADHNST